MGCDEKFSMNECVESVDATAYDHHNEKIESSRFDSQVSVHEMLSVSTNVRANDRSIAKPPRVLLVRTFRRIVSM